MLEGKHHGLLQLIRALHLGNTHRRTGVAGLDKDRETAQLDGDLHLQVEQRGNCSLAHAEPVGSLDAGGIQDDVGVLLIHADGAGADIGAHAGDPGQVAEALHRAVLGKAAVHHREHGIQPGGLRLTVPKGHQTMHCPVRREEGGQVAAILLPGVVDELVHLAGVAQPAPVPGDAHHHNIIFFAVDIFQHRGGGHQRYIMLAAGTAEQDADRAFFHHQRIPPIPNIRIYHIIIPMA